MSDGRAADGIGRHRLQFFGKFFRRGDAFRKHDDVAVLTVGTAAVDTQDNVFHVVRDLGHDDDLCTAGNAGIQRNVAAAAPHHFHDADTFVRGHGVAQLVDDIQTGVDGRIESECIICIFEVVVDGAGDADGGDAVLFAQAFGAAERTVSADDDETFDPTVVQGLNCLFLPFHRIHFHTAGGAENGASALNDIGNAAHFHGYHVIVDQAGISLTNAKDLHSEIFCSSDDRPDTGVHSGGIAAACQDTDPLHNNPPNMLL